MRTDCFYAFRFSDLRSSGLLRNFGLWLFTDVSGQPICPIFKGQAVHFVLDCLVLKYDTVRLSRNVGKQPPTNQPTNTA
jgi:hypothetical protein